MRGHGAKDIGQQDLLRARLDAQINMNEPLVRLGPVIRWEYLDSQISQLFSSRTGRPATSTRLIVGLMYLQHSCGLSDEEVVFLTSTLSHLNTLILFAINFKLHTTAFAFMRLCCCFYLVFTTAVDLFVFAQILPRPNTFAQRRRAHQLRSRSGINRLLLACSLQRHQCCLPLLVSVTTFTWTSER